MQEYFRQVFRDCFWVPPALSGRRKPPALTNRRQPNGSYVTGSLERQSSPRGSPGAHTSKQMMVLIRDACAAPHTGVPSRLPAGAASVTASSFQLTAPPFTVGGSNEKGPVGRHSNVPSVSTHWASGGTRSRVLASRW